MHHKGLNTMTKTKSTKNYNGNFSEDLRYQIIITLHPQSGKNMFLLPPKCSM